MQTRHHLNALFLVALLGVTTAAEAQVQPELAKRYFEEATKLCERDAGRLWGVSLCGPMVIVDQATGTRATSQLEPEGQPPRFSGFADGPVSWGGLRWFSWPLYMLANTDADVRQQNMLHGLFHRIQPELGFMQGNSDGFNEHLDTLEGRVWMQLEWRALRGAVESSGSDRAEAIADALAFRSERATQAISVGNHCYEPAYTTRTVERDSFLGSEFKLAPGSLTPLHSLEGLTLLEVSCGGARWAALGGRLIGIDADHALAPWDGVFFELARDHDFRAAGQEPFWRLEIRKGKEIRFTSVGKADAVTPAPRPETDQATGIRVYHAVTEANDLPVVIKPTPAPTS